MRQNVVLLILTHALAHAPARAVVPCTEVSLFVYPTFSKMYVECLLLAHKRVCG